MPVILPSLADPFDLVIQGDELRSFATAQVVDAPSPIVVSGGQDVMMGAVTPMIEDDEVSLGVYTQAGNIDILRSEYDGSMIANNACIMTPCGARVFIDRGHALINPFIQSTNTFTLTGITRDSTGAVLGNCDVIIFKTGDDVKVAQTISDGSGNYSVVLPTNSRHYVVSYKTGSPDVTGATLNTLTAV